MAEQNADDGVKIDLISAGRMEGKTSMEKIRMILDSVHEGDIVVLEKGLTPDEESRLIEVTMTEINPDDFKGIEIESFPGGESRGSGLFDRIMGKSDDSAKLTVIGPANQIQSLHKDETLISALLKRQ